MEQKFPCKVRCIDNTDAEDNLEKGKIYTALSTYWDDHDYMLEGVALSWARKRFEIVQEDAAVEPTQEKRTIDSHYNFDYVLKESDIEAGKIKVDPYFVAKQWRLGSKDDTGVLFHCLKNISRYSDKNSKEREIKALYLQIKRLAELENVSLNEMVLEILDKK